MNEYPVILTINCGSSSVKFSVLDELTMEPLLTGICEGINTESATLTVNSGKPVKLAHSDYEDALAAISLELERRHLTESVAYIGHRIAHGGAIFGESVLLTDDVVEQIRAVSPLAPLHNYANLSGVASAMQRFPGVPQVAVFDTSFHQTMPPETYLYGLPYRYFKEHGVRRYGFHGTSHRYVSMQASELAELKGRSSGLVIAHLGNGASVCAVVDGQSVDTSMGMTPLEGLIMGTRCGDVDFGAMVWLARQTGQSLDDLEQVANTESGLLGLSGISSDLRTLEKARLQGDTRSELAINTFVHRIAKTIGGHATSLPHFDGLIFTGGIGENSALIRRLVIQHLRVFGFELDEEKNMRPNSDGERVISAKNSAVLCAVIPTNEEKMIALDARELGKASQFAEFA
ncbi:propionate kinase [Cedecea neteri]|uniref:propionate kinase n=1 Tax=Cedecea neteri TaxID=158822 RepID=UPI0004F75887|nr:propionate kinase [Cedecea neteri]AIR63841.1 propionate kinase [Cedecea neteri]